MIKKRTMKYLTRLLLISVILIVSACNKNGISPKPRVKDDATLPGKWKVVGNMLSAGGPMYFVPSYSNDYVDFNTDGSMSGSAFPEFKSYAVKDTVKISLIQTDMVTHADYYYKIKGDSLNLSPAGPPFCIEGCALVLVKQ